MKPARRWQARIFHCNLWLVTWSPLENSGPIPVTTAGGKVLSKHKRAFRSEVTLRFAAKATRKIAATKLLRLQTRHDCSICAVRFPMAMRLSILRGCGFVFCASSLRLLSNERSESFPLRHDASRFRHNETSRHRGCNSRSDVSALRSRPKIFGQANGGAASGTALGSISLRQRK